MLFDKFFEVVRKNGLFFWIMLIFNAMLAVMEKHASFAQLFTCFLCTFPLVMVSEIRYKNFFQRIGCILLAIVLPFIVAISGQCAYQYAGALVIINIIFGEVLRFINFMLASQLKKKK